LSTLPIVKNGRVRALAVTTAARNAALPDVPAVSEIVPGYAFSGWYAVLVPARTPREITTVLNREIVALLQAPDVRERLAAEGSTVVASTPEQLTAHLKQEIGKWERVVKQANIRLETTR
jgi:tripartite-type tricarboxylate transporter receptor subunit TctC